MTTKEWRLVPEVSLTKRLVAGSLLAGSRMLTRLARSLKVRQVQRLQAMPVYEFYAEAGAPEGALYVDGQLVGHLPGVSRL